MDEEKVVGSGSESEGPEIAEEGEFLEFYEFEDEGYVEQVALPLTAQSDTEPEEAD